MSNVEANVDNNMNKTDGNNLHKVQITHNSKDVERGKKTTDDSDSRSWGRPVAMIIGLLVLAAAVACSWVFRDWQTGLIVWAVLAVLYFIIFYYKWIYIFIVTQPRDMKALYCYVKLLRLTGNFNKKKWAMPDIFHEHATKHPDKPCFLFEEESWSFKQIEEYSLRTSAVLKAQGIKRGDTVGVMMSNCPEMPAIWLGNARIGGISPLINTNQTGAALLHSINVAKCDAVIYGSEYESAIQDVRKDLSPSLKLLKFTRRPLNSMANGRRPLNTSDNAVSVVDGDTDFTSLLETTPPPQWFLSEGDGFNAKILYIYTSGTTGLPKAAVISTSRMVFMAAGVHILGSLKHSDIFYCPMPLYHSAGGCVSVGQAFVFGCTVVLRIKFSATSYFPDCIKYKATAAHYIGEMCRYILSTPPSPTDRQHKVKTMYGNGMRPAIWTTFVKRFNIKKVVEFYGATEGNANILNIDNKPGAIGFISRIFPGVYPVAIIKVDDTGEPIRNKKGLCQVAKPNEPGVFIGKIQPNNPSRVFLGYVDKEASEKKIVRDVFTHGDSAFISGDILVFDELGYLYFRDRTGDTFRWRGENVSTTEVEAAISKVADQRDAVVYGVEIPNIEGRAGMCAIVDTDGTLDMDRLIKDITKDLPKYAVPMFIRIVTSVDMTGTYKMKKGDLQKEGYDPATVKDKLFYLDLKLNKYVPLGSEEYEKIVSGVIRL